MKNFVLISTLVSLFFASESFAQLNSLRAYYPFSGNANDSSGNSNKGTLHGGATVHDTLLLGDNNKDILILPSRILKGLNTFAISFKIKFTRFHLSGNSPTNNIICGDRLGFIGAFEFSYNKDLDSWQFAIENNHLNFSDASVEEGKWYFVELLRDASGIVHLFKDGVENAGSYSALGIINIDTLLIGQEDDCMAGCFVQDQCTNAMIDELKIYGTPFTQSGNSDGLSCYYPFSGNANDISGNRNHGKTFGGATTNGTLSCGDNIKDAFSIPKKALNGLSPFSIVFDINFTQFHLIGNSPTNNIIGGDRSGFTSAFAFSYDKALNEWQLAIENSHLSFADSDVKEGKWYNIGLVRDSSNILHLYKDGVSNPTTPSATSTIKIDTLLIGQENDCFAGCFAQNQCMYAQLDEVKIYNRPLTQSEIIKGYTGCSAYFISYPKGDSVYFLNNSSKNAKKAYWDLGDGDSSGFSSSGIFAHHYSAAGDYNVCLITSDSVGACIDTFCRSVRACDIRASFTYSIKDNAVKCISTSNSADKLHWSFGDGIVDNGNQDSVTHYYYKGGHYKVLLQIWDSASICFDSTSVSFDVTLPGIDTLSGTVFNDINGNGVQDVGETGVKDIKVALSNNSVTMDRDTTDSNGHFEFLSGNGTWSIKITYQSPWSQTFPSSPAFYTVTDTTGQSISGFNFGLHNNRVTLSGSVYYDNNNNGVRDSAEAGVPHQPVHIATKNYYTDNNGNYSVSLNPAIYKISLTPTLSGYAISTPDSGFYRDTATLGGVDYGGNDFGIWADPSLKNLRVDISTFFPALRGFEAEYYISYANIGNNPAHATVNMDYDGKLVYGGSDPDESTVDEINHIASWDLGNINPGEHGAIDVWFGVPQSLALGSAIKNIVDIQPITGDNFPQNNVDSLQDKVVGSFDPNDKAVSPPDSRILPGQKLEYTIRFQNTGTYPAVNINIVDTLSQDLDWGTFKMLSSSHPYLLEFSDGGVAKWTFTNIMLPDSGRDQAGSNGFVKFEIYPKGTIVNGTDLKNFADIYFDFNEPVRTNTVSSMIDVALGMSKPKVEQLSISVYPNPMNDYTNLIVTGTSNEDYEVSVLNVLGQEVKFLRGKTGVITKIRREDLSSGMYMYKVKMYGVVVGEGKLAVR